MKLEITLSSSQFDLDATFGCGQCFRWQRQADGSYTGVADGKELTIRRMGELLLLEGAGDAPFWKNYFDLSRDYEAIKSTLCSDPTLRRAVQFAPGIRILRQEPWEALCSFIISQNNNISRIKGILARLCENFGKKLPGGGYSFPSADVLSRFEPEDLAVLRSGFRTGYILDAAKKVASGEASLDKLERLELAQARAELQKIRGVGPKVADCALLFGSGRADCFPVDVWVRRVLDTFYPQGFPEEFAGVGGIAQQYLFHYARCCPECEWPGAKRA